MPFTGYKQLFITKVYNVLIFNFLYNLDLPL